MPDGSVFAILLLSFITFFIFYGLYARLKNLQKRNYTQNQENIEIPTILVFQDPYSPQNNVQYNPTHRDQEESLPVYTETIEDKPQVQPPSYTQSAANQIP